MIDIALAHRCGIRSVPSAADPAGVPVTGIPTADAASIELPPGAARTRSRRSDEVRTQVAAAIRDRGHDVAVGHGLSDFTVDIAVRRPGAAQWQVAVILDGPDWARRSTVADRDGAPLHLSRHMRWPQLLRFWLPAWLRDREEFLREVDEAVRRATEHEQPVPPAPVAAQPAAVAVPPGEVAAQPAAVAVPPKPRARKRAPARPKKTGSA